MKKKNRIESRKSKWAKWSKYSWDDKLFSIIVYVVVILIALCCLYPIYYTVIASLSEPSHVYTGKVSWLPSSPTLESYKLVFQNKSIWRGYANSIFYTVVGTCFNLFLTIPTAYALSKSRMFGRSFFMGLFTFTMFFGGGMIPSYILLQKMHLLNTPWIMIISGGISVYNVVVSRTYFQTNIPETLYEAARIDGASEFKIFLQFVIPLSAPIIAVITLYYAVGHWSSYFSAMIYLTDNDLQPLQVVLRRILILNQTNYDLLLESGADEKALESAARQAELATTMKYALVFVASAPMLMLYPFIQQHFVKGIMVGSLKG